MQAYLDMPGGPDLLAASIGLLVIRLVLGLYMAGHGAQKLWGWFGGHGVGATAGFFEQIGFRPGRPFVVVAALAEVVSGLLMAAGLLGPVGPALMLSVLIVAMVTVHWANGLFAQTNGVEHTVIFGAGALALALTGPGLLSLDAALGLQGLWTPEFAWTAIAVGVVGGIGNLAIRRPPPVPAGD